MGRLIDDDELLENYDLKNATKYGNKTAQQQEHSYSSLMMYEIADMIEDAPTAYDVEAVVKQIEEFVECNDECSKTFYQGRGCKACAYKEIIEIVRNGGVK